ncbi:MAG TPA: LDL receptor domain-containing protein, partial [Polyangiaceae bacterium]
PSAGTDSNAESGSGGTATTGDGGTGGTGGSTGGTPSGTGGSTGGTSSGAGQAGSSAGSSASGGTESDAGGAAGEGASGGGSVPVEVMDALAIDDPTIDAASGEALLELARRIGFARGYLLCSCSWPGSPLPPEDLDACAIEEAGPGRLLADPMKARCIAELSRAVPGFDEYLRCWLKNLREQARSYLTADSCLPMATFGSPSTYVCPLPDPQVSDLLNGLACERAFECEDGRFFPSARCDLRPDCDDWEDERNCAEFGGSNVLLCDNELLFATSVCSGASRCGLAADPPFCTTELTSRFLCGDGTDISVTTVCDNTENCASGRDEELCLF